MPMPWRRLKGEIIPGAGRIIDQWLGLNVINPIGNPPHYRHAEAFQNLYPVEWPDLCGEQLASLLYKRLCRLWCLMMVRNPRHPGGENWRFEKMLDLATNPQGDEVPLERTIVRITGDDWVNQCPTFSGLLDDQGRKCNIDLIHRLGTEYEFVELKVKVNTPLYAAMEILQYGIVYVFSRIYAVPLTYSTRSLEVLNASAVHLRVLAPLRYYPTASLAWLHALQTALSDGLHQFSQGLPGLECNLDFAFESFPAGFAWNLQQMADEGHCKDLLWALHKRKALTPDGFFVN